MKSLLIEIDIILNNILTIGIHLVDDTIIQDDIIKKCNGYNLLFLESKLFELKNELITNKDISKITLIISIISESLEILNHKMDYDLILGNTI